jgi:hypothetical protein
MNRLILRHILVTRRCINEVILKELSKIPRNRQMTRENPTIYRKRMDKKKKELNVHFNG